MAGDISGYTPPGTFVNGSATVPIDADFLNNLAAAVQRAHTWIGRQDLRFRHLESFSGANSGAKLRQAITENTGEIVLVTPGTTLDAGANNPFIFPSGFHIMGIPGSEDEFGYNCPVYIRHTGSNSGSAGHGVFQWASGSKGQKISGISFQGTTSTRAFVDVALDGSDGRFPQYVTFNSVSFNQFESVMQATGTGIKIMGAMYCNNFACTRPPWYLAGSDHTLFSNGCLMEMGGAASYATRAALVAMFRGGTLSNTSFGPIYWTGSPTTPVRFDGGVAGIDFIGSILEGRPNHSGGTLHCAGPLARLVGGRGHFRMREHGYAMRAPADAPFVGGGFYHIEGGDWLIDGGTFTPYAVGEYPSYALPNGSTKAAGTQPHFVWVTSTSARVQVKNITRGPNVTGTPVVMVPAAASVNTVGANIQTDNSVQVVTY